MRNTLDYYKNQLGSLDAYLGKFQDVAYYRSSPCFSARGARMPNAQRWKQNRRLASSRRRRPTMPCSRADQQQDALTADARTLQRLQGAAQGATGQMQAIGYANQLASQQANQLLQIRGLLIAQQNAIATRRMQALADREAQQLHRLNNSARAATSQALHVPGKEVS
jgi:P-type conjugative transfer protein TrbJ